MAGGAESPRPFSANRVPGRTTEGGERLKKLGMDPLRGPGGWGGATARSPYSLPPQAATLERGVSPHTPKRASLPPQTVSVPHTGRGLVQTGQVVGHAPCFFGGWPRPGGGNCCCFRHAGKPKGALAGGAPPR